MPSITAYTPYETLTFVQSVAHHGADTSNFDEIATSLKKDKLIVESENYDNSKLTANALQQLLSDLLQAEKDENDSATNGEPDSRSSNQRKSKPVAPPIQNGSTEEFQQLAQPLVDKLYGNFREQTIREIKEQEEEYGRLSDQIRELERLVELEEHDPASTSDEKVQRSTDTVQEKGAKSTAQSRAELSAGLAHAQSSRISGPEADDNPQSQGQQDIEASKSSQLATTHTPVVPSQRSPTGTAAVPSSRQSGEVQGRPAHPSPNTPRHQSPGTFDRARPSPTPQHANYSPIMVQHGSSPGSHRQVPPINPAHQVGPQMPPPRDHSIQKSASPEAVSGRGSPIALPPQHQYPVYPQYPQPTPWQSHIPPQHPYQSHVPYVNRQFYQQSPGRQHPPFQTPQQLAYQAYPHTAPIRYHGQPPSHGWPNQPYYAQSASANTTPVPRMSTRRGVLRSSGSSTPWRRRSDRDLGHRAPSPNRPDREVSPLSESESLLPEIEDKKSRGNQSEANQLRNEGAGLSRQTNLSKRARTNSATPSGFENSRSQSIVSYTSELPTDKSTKTRKSQNIKAEPPSTPIPMTSDTDQGHRSSGRRGRPRNNTLTSRSELQRTGAVGKRKRSLAREISATPLPASPAMPSSRHYRVNHDPSMIIVSKTFAKTAQLLLNEITSHKLAGVFAKPLSERDAPGYKDLILRPQDLKSIKAAVSKGGKAALSAIELLESEREDMDETSTQDHIKSELGNKEGPIGNGMYLVSKTEDLLPPKGIVTSSQMELELVRMFANAVMFNPLPTNERGFGRSLQLRKNGGTIEKINLDRGEDGGTSSDEDDEDEESSTPEDDGGIIVDTREMFTDVMSLVAKWRELEDERVGGGTEGGVGGVESVGKTGHHSIRHSSISSMINEEEQQVVDVASVAASTPTATAPSRKRRKLVEGIV